MGAALRFLLASVILVALAVVQRQRLRPSPAEVRLIAVFGILVFGLDYGLIYWAEGFIPSGLTAILFATMPFQTALAAALLATEVLTARKLLGMVIGFAGLLLVFRDHLGLAGMEALGPMLAVVAAAGCAGVGSVLVKRQGQTMGGIPFNGLAMAFGGTLQLGGSAIAGEGFAPPEWPAGVLSILYLALFGSVYGFVGYFWLLRTMEATTLSFIALVTPTVALGLGVLVAGEPLEAMAALGSTLILLGIAVATMKAAPKAPPAPEVAASPPAGRSR
jgi:drug/metabolite transporter (DMT)-like permease